MALSKMVAVATLCITALLMLQVDARALTSPTRDLLASLNNGCDGGSPTCYTASSSAGYCCPKGYNCYSSDKFSCYAASESGAYPSEPDLIVGENVAGGGVSSGNSLFPSSSDPECRNTPGRTNPCFSDDGSVNVCCSTPCGRKTKQGYPTCSGQCSGPTQLLYVWAGVVPSDGGNSNVRDYVGVVSLDRNNQYGKLLYRAETPYQGSEAHHMGQSPDNKFLVAGGVFASVQGIPQVYFYDIDDDPYHPRFTGDIDPKNSGITDQVVFDSQGRAIITQMGSYNGGTPGRLLEIYPPFPTETSSPKPAFAEYGAGAPGEDTMNPHGLDVNPDSTVAITGDFIEPVSLFSDALKLRDTIRIWRRDFNGSTGWTNTKTITLTGAFGVQDVQFIPGDAQQRAIATLVGGNGLAIVNPVTETAKVVYDFEGKACIPHVGDVSNDGKRYFVSCINLGEVWMLDISDPEKPVKLDAKDCGGPASNPHFVRLSPDDDRLFVSNYFVTAGLATSTGNRNVLSFNVKATSLEVDTAFAAAGSLSFADVIDENGIKTNSRPHGMTVNYLSC